MIQVSFTTYGGYTTDSIYQWDLDRIVEIRGISLETAPILNFWCKNIKEAVVVRAEYEEGVIRCKIPNVLLQWDKDIIVYVCECPSNCFETCEQIRIPVIKRARPADYVYRDNVPLITGIISDEVDDWLNKHPEATTTVLDRSLTSEKLVVGTLGYVTPEMFGANGNGVSDDTEAIQNAIDYAKDNKVFVKLGLKTYCINDTLTLHESSTVLGVNRGGKNTEDDFSTTVIRRISDKPIFNASGLRNVYLSDITFNDSVDCTQPQIIFKSMYMFHFNNLFFSSKATHLQFENQCFDSRLDNCFFGASSNVAVDFIDATDGRTGCNEINFNDCHWEHYTNTALRIGRYNHDIRFNNCKFESIYTSNCNVIEIYGSNIYFDKASYNVNTTINSVLYLNACANIIVNGQITMTDTSKEFNYPFVRCVGSCEYDMDLNITNLNVNKYLNNFLIFHEDKVSNYITNKLLVRSNWQNQYFANAGKRLCNITINRPYEEIGTDDLSNINNRSGKTVSIDKTKRVTLDRITNPSTGTYESGIRFEIDGVSKIPFKTNNEGLTTIDNEAYMLPHTEHSEMGVNHFKFTSIPSIGSLFTLGVVNGVNKQLRIGASTSIPSEGDFLKGDTIFNFTPSSGNFVGWVCVESGNPGTWKGFGKIE